MTQPLEAESGRDVQGKAKTSLPSPTGPSERWKTLARVLRYISIRMLAVLITVALGIYAALLVTNLGGSVDEKRREEVRTMVLFSFMGNEWYMSLSYEEKQEAQEQLVAAAYAQADLDKPFFQRSLRYFRDAMSLDLGEARNMRVVDSGSRRVKDLILEGLPLTLLVFGVANLLTFFVSLFLALLLSQKYGHIVDRAVTLLIPAFAAPPWLHSVFLIILFASLAGILPYGGIVSTPPPGTSLGYAASMLHHMILPVLAWMLGTIPFALYANRAFFLIHSSEDYVELAVAKGLRPRRIRSRHILRPVLPPVITSFALMLITAWQGAVLTEFVFAWPGIGQYAYQSVTTLDFPAITGVALLIAVNYVTINLVVDILYGVIDPRVRNK